MELVFLRLEPSASSTNEILLTTGQCRPPQIICCSIRLHLTSIDTEPGDNRGATPKDFLKTYSQHFLKGLCVNPSVFA